jgi:hypothetical protein
MLKQGSEERFKELWASLSTATQGLIEQWKPDERQMSELAQGLIDDLNRMLAGTAAVPEMIRWQLSLAPASGEVSVLEKRAAMAALFPMRSPRFTATRLAGRSRCQRGTQRHEGCPACVAGAEGRKLYILAPPFG